MSIKLSPRNLFLVVVAACVLAVAMWYLLRYQVRQTELTGLKTDLETVQARVAVLRANQQALPALREQVAALRVQENEFLTALPDRANYYKVLDEVRLDVAGSGASMSSFGISSGALGTPAPGVRPMNINLSLTGRFGQLFGLLRALETMNRFSNITALNLSISGGATSDPILGSSLAMTVYTFENPQPNAPADGTTAPNAAPAAPAAGGTP